MSRLCMASVYVYATDAPHFDSSVNGFSADKRSCVLFVSMPLLPMMRLPSPGGGLPQGCERFSQNSPSGYRLPSVNTKPFLLLMRANATLVFQSPSRLRMPRLN